MFCVAGLVRLASGVGTALAAGSDGAAEAPAGIAAPAAPVRRNAPSGDRAAAELLVDVTRREEALRLREAALDEREALLGAASTRLETQIAALVEAEQALAATMALADRAAEDDINRMVSVFESMKADEAGQVFAEMEPVFAAGFLARLSPDVAGSILAALEPRLAYHLSAIVAGRNARVPQP